MVSINISVEQNEKKNTFHFYFLLYEGELILSSLFYGYLQLILM